MNSHPLIYKNKFGTLVRFRKVKERVYEREDSAIIGKSRLAYKYTFIKDERVKEVFETTVNGFRVRRKASNALRI